MGRHDEPGFAVPLEDGSVWIVSPDEMRRTMGTTAMMEEAAASAEIAHDD